MLLPENASVTATLSLKEGAKVQFVKYEGTTKTNPATLSMTAASAAMKDGAAINYDDTTSVGTAVEAKHEWVMMEMVGTVSASDFTDGVTSLGTVVITISAAA